MCQFEPIFIHDRDARVDYAPELPARVQNPPHYKLYVRDFEGDEDALRAVFREHENYIVRVTKGACCSFSVSATASGII